VLKDGLGIDGNAALLQASNSVPTPKGTSVEVRHVFGQENFIQSDGCQLLLLYDVVSSSGGSSSSSSSSIFSHVHL
jgi:hypothetical protein